MLTFVSVVIVGMSEEVGAPTQYSAEVLTNSALAVIERALWDPRPHARYHLAVPNSKFNIRMPCRAAMKLFPVKKRIQKV